jgi:hypothetical protein
MSQKTEIMILTTARTSDLILSPVCFPWDVRLSLTRLKKLQVKLGFAEILGFHGEELNCGLLTYGNV